MTWFVDTNVLVYAVTDTTRRQPCLALLHAVATGDLPATTNALVIEELWHLERRLGLPAETARDAVELFPSIVRVGDWILLAAMSSDVDPAVGTADRIHAATCRVERLEGLISADRAFDAIAGLHRVEPDAAGLAAILR